MVYLYSFQCPREKQRAFWQARLPEILLRDFGLERCVRVTRPNGKPALQDNAAFFNVSHSRDRLVIAAADAEVGVDIEALDRTVSERLRRYCLTETELARTPPEDKQTFIRIWTAKESYLKLYGTGLRQSMRSFSALGDRFSSPQLPPAVFQRIELGAYTVCIATEQKQKLKVIQL